MFSDVIGHIFHRVFEGPCNLQKKILEGARVYWQHSEKLKFHKTFCRWHIFARGLPIPSGNLPKGSDYSLAYLVEGI